MKKFRKLIPCAVITTLIFSLFSAFPSSASARYNPIIILKFDDLGVNNIDNFQKCFDILQSYDIDSAGFGVIGKNLEDSVVTDELISKIKEWNSAGIEIWHHGYSHTEGEYNSSSYEAQKESFGKTCDLLKEKTGITITSFGSPFNNADETTVKVINESFNTLFEGEACGTTTTFEDFDIEGRGRFVRIYCMGNSVSNWNAIKEIIIYK